MVSLRFDMRNSIMIKKILTVLIVMMSGVSAVAACKTETYPSSSSIYVGPFENEWTEINVEVKKNGKVMDSTGFKAKHHTDDLKSSGCDCAVVKFRHMAGTLCVYVPTDKHQININNYHGQDITADFRNSGFDGYGDVKINIGDMLFQLNDDSHNKVENIDL